jgi:RimJ/RimL family protein N-acetyltransferase
MSLSLAHGDVLVRPLAAGDTLPLYEAVRASVDSLAYWLPWCHAGYSLADAVNWVDRSIESWANQSEFPLGIFSTRGEFLGGTGLSHVDRGHNLANIGYWVSTPHRGKGVACVGAALAARLGFRELGFTRLEIVVLPHNLASLRVAEKLGATREVEARNRVMFQGKPASAIVYSLVPDDILGT